MQVILDHCDWNRPGHNAYQLNPVEAVASYGFSDDVKTELIRKMNAKEYDDLVIIDKDSIYGLREYTNLRNMHFGKGDVCKTVDRQKWGHFMTRGLVYCVEQHCLVVPFICKNVSEITPLTPDIPVIFEEKEKNEERVNKVPEPSSLWLCLLALAAILLPWKRK